MCNSIWDEAYNNYLISLKLTASVQELTKFITRLIIKLCLMNEKVIEVEGLTKIYDGDTAVNNISFSVKKGEIFSMVGPNGAGKTTTVEILECLRTPTSGTAKVLGHDIEKEEEKIKEKIGVMPQDFNTFERLSAEENIQLMADIYNSDNVEEIIDMVGISNFKDKKFNDLSGRLFIIFGKVDKTRVHTK